MSEQVNEIIDGSVLSMDEANALVVENQGWAESIARSVARSWGIDFQSEGLDGAAMEALIYCSRRFNPSFSVPFRAYARKRIHESACEAAKKSKGWRRIRSSKTSQDKAKVVASQLVQVFPELREGALPDLTGNGTDSQEDARASIRQMLLGASLIIANLESQDPGPDQMMDYRRMVKVLATLEPVHQLLMYRVYWDGISLRSVASEWDTDGLNVIREHKTIVEYLHKELAIGKQFLTKPKVRPGLRDKASELKKQSKIGPFSETLLSFQE